MAEAYRRRRRSYRHALRSKILWRYALCLVLFAASAVAAPLAAAIVYVGCGLCLSRYIEKRAIWVKGEPAQKVADDRRGMLMLWPVQTVRYMRLVGGAPPVPPRRPLFLRRLRYPRAADIA